MVPAGNKAKRYSSVNHTTLTIHHHHHQSFVLFSLSFMGPHRYVFRRLWVHIDMFLDVGNDHSTTTFVASIKHYK